MLNKVKISELTGVALDWAVVKAEGLADIYCNQSVKTFNPSTSWAQGGLIIEREKISLLSVGLVNWAAKADYGDSQAVTKYGDTPLIAAMRCYVASKLGDTVEISKELM